MVIRVLHQSFSRHTKFSEKQIFLNPLYTRSCAYQGIRNVSFSENILYLLNGSFLRFLPYNNREDKGWGLGEPNLIWNLD